jgi:predicted DNA-binding antitoxin AbrB/MazE fold protein
MMGKVIEAVYEEGVLKPTGAHGLKEHHRYRVVVEELNTSAELPAEDVANHVQTLPDGRRVARLGGVFAAAAAQLDSTVDPIADALDDLRRERDQRFRAGLDAAHDDQDA